MSQPRRAPRAGAGCKLFFRMTATIAANDEGELTPGIRWADPHYDVIITEAYEASSVGSNGRLKLSQDGRRVTSEAGVPMNQLAYGTSNVPAFPHRMTLRITSQSPEFKPIVKNTTGSQIAPDLTFVGVVVKRGAPIPARLL